MPLESRSFDTVNIIHSLRHVILWFLQRLQLCCHSYTTFFSKGCGYLYILLMFFDPEIPGHVILLSVVFATVFMQQILTLWDLNGCCSQAVMCVWDIVFPIFSIVWRTCNCKHSPLFCLNLKRHAWKNHRRCKVPINFDVYF